MRKTCENTCAAAERYPDTTEEKPEEICSLCGNGIYQWDVYYKRPKGAVCMDCLSKMTAVKVLTLAGEHLTTA